MADNIDVTPGAGKTIGADEVSSVLYQRVKVVWGPDGTVNDADVATGKRLPVQAAIESSVMTNAGASLTPKYAKISVSSSGANEIVAAVTSKKIRVVAWDLSPNAAVNAKWQSHTAGDISGLYYMAGQGNGQARNFNPAGWFETTAGEALDLNLSSGVAVGGVVVYVEI